MKIPTSLLEKLDKRKSENALRKLELLPYKIDFFSNDYLGFARSSELKQIAQQFLNKNSLNGATGSRLISGNNSLFEHTEKMIANFHNTEDALIFNSGYDANIGIFSSIPQKGEVVLYDQYCHASIRDGLQMTNAQAFKFKHNDLIDLEHKLKKHEKQTVFVVTESVFSMDGDSPDLSKLVEITHKYNAFLIIDEAHSLGVFGDKGEGLIQSLGLEKEVFIRLVTFGKGLGTHGAAVLSNKVVKEYLVNFARSFIYTTALPAHSVAHILAGYTLLSDTKNRTKLAENITYFRQKIKKYELDNQFIISNSAIQAMVVSGNDQVKQTAQHLYEKGFGIKPILSPTVPKGEERLRICLHSFNTFNEIDLLFDALVNFF